MGILSAQDLAFFEENGYVLARGVISKEQAAVHYSSRHALTRFFTPPSVPVSVTVPTRCMRRLC